MTEERAGSAGEPAVRPEQGWLARHPRATRLALALTFALAADLVCGLFLIELDAGSFRCPHPYYHHGFLPDVSTVTRWGEREYPFHTNSLGFRDRAPREVELDSTQRRIVVIGDSFVEGMGVTWEESFLGQLEQRLGPDVELLNAGAVSYCPLLYRLKVSWLLEQVGLRFDELVVFIDISDIQDEVNYQSFQPRLPDPLDRALTPLRALLARRSFTFHAISAILRRERGGISNAIDTSKLADNEIYFADLEAYGVEGGQASAERGRWEWTMAEPLMEAWGRRGLELARADMGALAELCRSRAIELVLVVYPSPVQIFTRDLDSIQVKFWREFADEKGLRLVNLFPTFVGKDAGRPRAMYNEFFIAGDVHWNPAGHRRVAEELLGQL